MDEPHGIGHERDADPGVRPSAHVWVGSKAPWWELDDDLPQFVEGFVPPGAPK